VLTVTLSPERRDNLQKIAQAATPVKGGSSMFWFACQQDYDLNQPESILDPIWITARGEEKRSLLD
jgi:hypothetical protein